MTGAGGGSVLVETATGALALYAEQGPLPGDDSERIMPGAIAIKGATKIAVIQPAPRDPIYFAALMLWARLAGEAATAETARDPRLPGFVRAALAAKSAQLDKFFRKVVAP